MRAYDSDHRVETIVVRFSRVRTANFEKRRGKRIAIRLVFNINARRRTMFARPFRGRRRRRR